MMTMRARLAAGDLDEPAEDVGGALLVLGAADRHDEAALLVAFDLRGAHVVSCCSRTSRSRRACRRGRASVRAPSRRVCGGLSSSTTRSASAPDGDAALAAAAAGASATLLVKIGQHVLERRGRAARSSASVSATAPGRRRPSRRCGRRRRTSAGSRRRPSCRSAARAGAPAREVLRDRVGRREASSPSSTGNAVTSIVHAATARARAPPRRARVLRFTCVGWKTRGGSSVSSSARRTSSSPRGAVAEVEVEDAGLAAHHPGDVAVGGERAASSSKRRLGRAVVADRDLADADDRVDEHDVGADAAGERDAAAPRSCPSSTRRRALPRAAPSVRGDERRRRCASCRRCRARRRTLVTPAARERRERRPAGRARPARTRRRRRSGGRARR